MAHLREDECYHVMREYCFLRSIMFETLDVISVNTLTWSCGNFNERKMLQQSTDQMQSRVLASCEIFDDIGRRLEDFSSESLIRLTCYVEAGGLRVP